MGGKHFKITFWNLKRETLIATQCHPKELFPTNLRSMPVVVVVVMMMLTILTTTI
jgi:hypothetical protein